MSINNLPEKRPFIHLTPFKMQVLTNFPYIEEDFDALTNYELLCKVVEYSKVTINNVNNLDADFNDLYSAYSELLAYVNNYFDSENFQELINNKLDEMAQDGTLGEIISRYIDSSLMRTYETNDDIINDNNLVKDMKVRSLGNEEMNDGRGCIYNISDTPPAELPINTNNENIDNFHLTLNNGLYAIPINDINDDYYKEVTISREIHNYTTCYFTTIPYTDEKGEEIIPYVKYNGGLDISDYARQHKTTFSMNCTLGVINPETELSENAVVISDGEMIYDNMNPPTFLNDYYKYVGIKDNRVFVDFQANITTGEQMIAQGVKQAFLCFGKLVDNGVITPYAQDTNDDIMKYSYPRQAIGVTLDKTIIVLTCDGRSTIDKGLTGIETAQLLIEKGCVNVWNLDGGGSTNSVYKGSRINKYDDDFDKERHNKERHIAYSLNIKKPTTNESIDKIMSTIGYEKANIIKMIQSQMCRPDYKNPAHCNDYIEGLHIYTCFQATESPNNEATGYLIVIPASSVNNTMFRRYCKQIWISRDTERVYTRSFANETWTAWKRYGTLFKTEIVPTANQSLGGSSYKTIELGNVSDYMPTSMSVNNSIITTSQGGGKEVNAYFVINVVNEGDLTLRLYKNSSASKAVSMHLNAGETKQICISKLLSLSTTDTLKFSTICTNNTGGENTIVTGEIIITENL